MIISESPKRDNSTNLVQTNGCRCLLSCMLICCVFALVRGMEESDSWCVCSTLLYLHNAHI